MSNDKVTDFNGFRFNQSLFM